MHIAVRGQTIETATRMDDHPSSQLKYKGRGEIRQGRMIIADDSLLDETEFASSIYYDLLKASLVGIWTGFDGQGHLIAAPAVLSRRELSKDQLIELVSSTPLSLIQVDHLVGYYSQGEVS
jgi:hypothetical protein